MNAYYQNVSRFKRGKSKRATEAQKAIVAEVWRQLGGKPEPITGPVEIGCIEIIPRDRRTPDIDAYWKGLLDALTVAGVWLDDRQVYRIGSIERLDPRKGCRGQITLSLWGKDC